MKARWNDKIELYNFAKNTFFPIRFFKEVKIGGHFKNGRHLGFKGMKFLVLLKKIGVGSNQ